MADPASTTSGIPTATTYVTIRSILNQDVPELKNSGANYVPWGQAMTIECESHLPDAYLTFDSNPSDSTEIALGAATTGP